MKKWILLSFFLSLMSCLTVAARAEGVDASTAPAVSGVQKTEPEYTYQADRFRDPFVPLAGQGAMLLPPIPQEDQVFKAEEMELKGILAARSGRMALLRGAGGGTYVVKDGKIIDSKRKAVKGYVGIVKEKSLVLIGPNNQITEIKIIKDKDVKSSTVR